MFQIHKFKFVNLKNEYGYTKEIDYDNRKEIEGRKETIGSLDWGGGRKRII